MSQREAQGGSGAGTAPPSASHFEPLPAPITVARPQFRGLLYHPSARPSEVGRRPAVALVPPPDVGVQRLDPFVAGLVAANLIVLRIEWGGPPTFPEALALLPGAVAFLAASADVDPARIGAGGVDIGGDLALRSASTDPQIRSVLAYAPHLVPSSPTHRGPVVSRRRPHAAEWSEFLAQIDVLSTLRGLVGRHVRVVYGAAGHLVDIARIRQELDAAGLCDVIVSVPEEGHEDIASTAAGIALAQSWFASTL